MDRQYLGPEFNVEQQRVITAIFDGAFGSPIALQSDPTTAGSQLAKNKIGFNTTTSKLFINLNGTTYSIAITAV